MRQPEGMQHVLPARFKYGIVDRYTGSISDHSRYEKPKADTKIQKEKPAVVFSECHKTKKGIHDDCIGIVRHMPAEQKSSSYKEYSCSGQSRDSNILTNVDPVQCVEQVEYRPP